MKNPKVTVLMSVYNGEKYLREAIDSILNQTFQNFEFIIINDGSTDSTGKILNSYTDPRIKVITNLKNQGLTKSLNIGLKLAKGKFIARQDADDISLPKRLEKEVEFLRNHPEVGLVGTQYIFIDENGKELHGSCMPLTDDEIQERLKISNTFCHGSVMMRKKCIEKVGLYNENFKYAQDYELWIRISKEYKVANLPEYLYRLRLTRNSISAKRGITQILYMEMVKKMLKHTGVSYSPFPEIKNPDTCFTTLEKIKILSKGYSYLCRLMSIMNYKNLAWKYLMKSLLLNPFDLKNHIKMTVPLLPGSIIKKIRMVKNLFFPRKTNG